MGITIGTIFAIRGNDDIICSAGGPDPTNGKYLGWITHGDKKYRRPLLTTNAHYASAAEATKEMEALVERIRKCDLDGDIAAQLFPNRPT